MSGGNSRRYRRRILPILWLAGMAGPVWSGDILDLSAFPVYAGALAAETGPGGGQLSERMGREARVDLQSRGGARYQTDITVRGGIFEGTGVQVGGMALFDPQTGHYFAEVPLDPAFFAGASLWTGVANSLRGFNSTAGTIDWAWAPLVVGGAVQATLGTDTLWGAGVRQAGKAGAGVWYELGVLRESGDGSVAGGDFRMERVSGRVEFDLAGGWMRMFGGHVTKFYGWPGMYTGRASLNETEDYAVTLLGWQWQSLRDGDRHATDGHRVGGYWRRLDDDYEFRRETPNRLFEHRTEVLSLQGDGQWGGEGLALAYRWVALRDRILRSTSLVHGRFDERDYAKGAALLRRGWETGRGVLTLYGGGAVDASSEDATAVLPMAGTRLSGRTNGLAWELYAEYAASSQVPGYTVLNSAPTGLFGGNPDAGRERARGIETGAAGRAGPFSGKLVVFERQDRDLVDWVYAVESPSARQAAALDARVRGIEGWLRWEGAGSALELGYAALGKDPDYHGVAGDASFYVLNHARHRLLALLEQRIGDALVVRLEGEYRRHPANALRTGGDEALRLHVEAVWNNFAGRGWQLGLRIDNLTKERFEPVPGTPGPGREGRLAVSYAW